MRCSDGYYPLGLVLFEMITGRRFSEEEHRFDGVPEKVAHVIGRCLEKGSQRALAISV